MVYATCSILPSENEKQVKAFLKREAGQDFTDDGGLLAAQGHLPAVVPGEAGNWKVTSNADWVRAQDLLK